MSMFPSINSKMEEFTLVKCLPLVACFLVTIAFRHVLSGVRFWIFYFAKSVLDNGNTNILTQE